MPSLIAPPNSDADIYSLGEQECAEISEPQGAEGRMVQSAARNAHRHFQRQTGTPFLEEMEALSSQPSADQRFIDQMTAAAGNVVSFAQRIQSGVIQVSSAELVELADRAAQQCAERGNEDVRAWAERLARDVSNATD